MWTAERDSTFARTDEDRAMAHVSYGSVVNRDDARNMLIDAIKDEIRYFVDGPIQYFNAYCVTRLCNILDQLREDPTRNEAEYNGLRFRIRAWKSLSEQAALNQTQTQT